MDKLTHSPWLKFHQRRSQPRVRLFCIPFAGAGASAYVNWQDNLNSDIQLIALQLPGRENRFSEPAIDNMSQLLDLLSAEMAAYTDTPWAVFGHSMGAAIGHQLVERLLNQGCPTPSYLLVSAKTPPHIPSTMDCIAELSDNELIEQLAARYGASIEGQQRDLMELMLPTLRADFKLIESLSPIEPKALPIPIRAFNGSLDHSVSAQHMSQWAEYSSVSFSQYQIDGPHFYLQSAMKSLTQHLNQIL